MIWIDIASIVFVCVTANHLGLTEAMVKAVTGRRHLPIISCPKCLTFWSVLAYGLCKRIEIDAFIPLLAISFLASYSAIWLELLEGIIDTLYNKVYEKIYPERADGEAASDGVEGDTDSTLSDMQENTN